jgi:hypothetical protein
MKKNLLLAAIAITFCYNYLVAQEVENPTNNPVIEFINNEKIRVKAIEAVDRFQHPEKYRKIDKVDETTPTLQADGDEVIVSARNIPESEIHAAINPKNPSNMVISPIKQDMNDATSMVTCPVYYTFDAGKTWAASNFITKPYSQQVSLMGGGDPVFVFDADGNLYFTWINLYITYVNVAPDSLRAAIFWAKSTDGGKTFQFDEKNHFDKIFSTKYSNNPQISQMLDKQWMAADKSNSQWRNSVYMSCLFLSQSGMSSSLKLRIYRKRANEAEFVKNPFVINTGNLAILQFGSIDVDANGFVHYVFYGSNGVQQELYHCISKDGGATFSNPVKITQLIGSMRTLSGTENVPGLSSQRIYPSPYMAVDNSSSPNSGNIYVTWTANGITSKLTKGLDIYFSRSTDAGATWSIPSIINNDGLNSVHNFYSNISVNDSGVIAITYYDRRNHVGTTVTQGITDYFLSTSFDGGKTFSNQKVSLTPSRFDRIGSVNNGFGIGEYNAVMMSKDYIYPVWADGRTNNGNINVYVARVKIDRAGTSVDEIKSISDILSINQILPNPANEYINVEFNSKLQSNGIIEIVDITGKSIANAETRQIEEGINQLKMNVNSLSSGSYFIKITCGNIYTVKQFQIIR